MGVVVHKYMRYSLYSFSELVSLRFLIVLTVLAALATFVVFSLMFKMQVTATATASKNKSKAGSKQKHILSIHGFEGCGYFAAALNAAKTYKKNYPGLTLQVNPVPRNLWESVIKSYALAKGIMHKTSPLIFYDNKYVGGHDAFIAQLKKSVPFS